MRVSKVVKVIEWHLMMNDNELEVTISTLKKRKDELDQFMRTALRPDLDSYAKEWETIQQILEVVAQPPGEEDVSSGRWKS